MPSTPSNQPPTDRLAWLWLIVGLTLSPFTQFQTVLPPAAWLAPVFLLRFVRTRPARLAFPALMLGQYVATVVALRGIFPLPMILILGLCGVAGAVSYALDRWLAGRLTGLARTLVFPSAAVTVDWLFAQSSLGTLGSPAYSQSGNLPLTQLLALSGIWGLVFLMAWFAPVVNEAWERGLSSITIRRSLAPFAVVLAATLTYGSVRIAFSTSGSSTVRVAALAADRTLRQGVGAIAWAELAAGNEDARARARTRFAPVAEELFARTRKQAQGGARIVLWSEADAFSLKEDEPAFLARAQDLARAEGIYLQLGLLLVLRADRFPFAENRAVLIGPDGKVEWDYPKTIHPFADASLFAPGPGSIPVAVTPYGRLAAAICFDADFPGLIRQAGRAGADLLLVLARDWRPVHIMHAHAATFRAIENGFSLVRATGDGLSIAVDRLGRVLATADSFATDALSMTANVLLEGAPTFYARWGDWAAYGCMIGLVILAAGALMRRRPGARTFSPESREATPTRSSP